MASRSYIVPNRTFAMRGSAGEAGKSSSAQKRKASTFLEVSMLRGLPSTGSSPSSVNHTSKNKAAHAEDHDEEHYGFAAAPSPRKKSRKEKPPEERRLRVFRKHAPQSFLERLERVRSQHMFLIDRERTFSTDSSNEEEVFDIAGTTGNIYKVKISRMPSCTCPDAKKGNQCKHIVYVSNITRAYL
jgi:hypothetical protein